MLLKRLSACKFNTSRRVCMVLAVLFYVPFCFAQKELQQADQLVNEKKYSEAIPLYHKLYEKKKDRTILLKLADANFLNQNYPQAQRYYAEYFHDTVYDHIPQFLYYAKSCKLVGKIPLAVKLYQKHYDITQDGSSRELVDTYKLFVDSAQLVRSYDLDSNYNCVTIDATESLDSLAAPMFYNWELDDGSSIEGIKFEHCFADAGEHKATLNVTDKKTGLLRKRDTLIVITIERLPVTFTAPKKGRRYFYVDFDASGTVLPGYAILDYLWLMDNGETSSGKKIKYKYNDSRDYRVKLVVIAQNKASGKRQLFSANKNINILENYEMPSKKFQDDLNGAK